MPAGPPLSNAATVIWALALCVLVVVVCCEIAYAVFMGLILPAAEWLLTLGK